MQGAAWTWLCAVVDKLPTVTLRLFNALSAGEIRNPPRNLSLRIGATKARHISPLSTHCHSTPPHTMPNSISINSPPTTTHLLQDSSMRTQYYSEIELVRTPPARSFTPTPPLSRTHSADGLSTAPTPGRLHGESDLSLLLRTLDFAARVGAFSFIDHRCQQTITQKHSCQRRKDVDQSP